MYRATSSDNAAILSWIDILSSYGGSGDLRLLSKTASDVYRILTIGKTETRISRHFSPLTLSPVTTTPSTTSSIHLSLTWKPRILDHRAALTLYSAGGGLSSFTMPSICSTTKTLDQDVFSVSYKEDWMTKYICLKVITEITRILCCSRGSRNSAY